MKIMLNHSYKLSGVIEDTVRVLYIGENEVALISLNSKSSLPYLISCDDAEKSASEEIDGKGEQENVVFNFSDTQKKHIEKNWDLIADVVKEEPACYEKKWRNKLISKQLQEKKTSRQQMHILLHKYWAGGKMKYALCPQYNNCGAAGKERSAKTHLGRHTEYGEDTKINIGEKERKQIKVIVEKYYNRQRCNFMECYRKLKDAYYTDKETNQLFDYYPTFGQFSYQARKYVNIKKRAGSIIYNKDMRGITGSSRSEADGPGDVYQIDATKADIYLVARDNRSLVIGRPVLYFVIDVFSHMIVGFHCSLGDASWENAKLALLNTFSNKVEVCKKYGVEIKSDDWPCEGLCHTLIVDNGELICKASDSIVEGLGITVKNEPAWRPDLKGIVESSFRLLNLDVKNEIPGTVKKDHRERTGKDYRYDALLNLDEFRQVIIYHILKYNAKTMKNNIQFAPDILTSQVRQAPIDLWNWGIENRTPNITRMDTERLNVYLSAREPATITPRGIKFHGMYYECLRARNELWFDKARYTTNKKVLVGYLADDVSHIFLFSNDGKYEICDLTADSHENFKGFSFDEVDWNFKLAKHQYAQSRRSNDQLDIDYSRKQNDIIEKAKAETLRNCIEIVNVKDIKENRRLENEERKSEQRFIPGSEKPETGNDEKKRPYKMTHYEEILKSIAESDDEE